MATDKTTLWSNDTHELAVIQPTDDNDMTRLYLFGPPRSDFTDFLEKRQFAYQIIANGNGFRDIEIALIGGLRCPVDETLAYLNGLHPENSKMSICVGGLHHQDAREEETTVAGAIINRFSTLLEEHTLALGRDITFEYRRVWTTKQDIRTVNPDRYQRPMGYAAREGYDVTLTFNDPAKALLFKLSTGGDQ